MAKRVNKPAVAIMTIAVMAMTIAASVLLIRSIPKGDPTPMVARGQAAMADGDYEAAKVAFAQAYRVSEDPKYLVPAGDAARALGDSQDAFGFWRQATLKDPRYVEPRQRSIDLFVEILEMRNWRARSSTWARLADDANSLLLIQPDNATALFARGVCYVNLRTEKPANEKQGVEDMLKAFSMQPDDVRVPRILGRYWVQKGESDAAQRLYEGLIKDRPEDAIGYQMLGELQIQQRKFDAALEQLTKAVKPSEGAGEAKLAVARAHMGARDFEKAETILRGLMASEADSFEAEALLNQLLIVMERPEDAFDMAARWLDKPGIRKGFKANVYRNQRIRMLLQAATACVALASEEGLDEATRERWVSDTEAYREQLIAETGQERPWTHMLAGHIHRLRGESAEAVKAFEVADETSGGADIQVNFQLAQLYRARGEVGACREVLRDVVDKLDPNNITAYRMLASVEFTLFNMPAALTYLDRGLALSPDNRDMQRLKAAILRRAGQSDQAEKIERRLGAPQTEREQMSQAAVMLTQGRTDEAEKIYRTILETDAANVEVLRRVLQLLLTQDRADEARTLLDTAQQVAPTNNRVRELDVLFLGDLSPEQRNAKVLELIKAEPEELSRNTQLYLYYLSRQQYGEARKIADALESSMGDDRRVITMQFHLALLEEAWDRAHRYAELAGSKDIDGAKGAFYRARIALTRGQWRLGEEEINAALSQFPSHSDGWVWLGQALAGLNRYDEAKRAFVRALELNPAKGEAYKGLAGVARMLDDKAEYEENLVRAVRLLPKDPWVLQQAELLVDEKNPAGAKNRRQRILQERPDDIGNILRLALLHEKVEEFNDADKLMEQAAALAPKDIGVAWAIATFWQRRGDSAKAEKTLVSLEQALDPVDKAKASILLAKLYLMQNLADKAEQTYHVAVKQDSSAPICLEVAEFYRATGRVTDAVQWYDKALAAEKQDLVEPGLIHRRFIEVLLQSRQFDEVDKQIEQYHAAMPDDETYLLMRGTSWMLQGRTEQAVAALTDYLRQEPNNAVGYYHRGLLYMAMEGRLSQAIEDLTQAKALSPSSLAYRHRIFLAQAYEAMGNSQEAIGELNSIIEEDPDALHVVRRLLDVYDRAGRRAELESLLRMYIARHPTDWTWRRILGRLGEVTEQYAKALEGYNEAAKLSEYAPAPVDDLLRVHIRFERYDRTIELGEKLLLEQASAPLIKSRVAEAYAKKGDKVKAHDLFNEVVAEAADDLPVCLEVIGRASLLLGMEDALQIVTQRSASAPDNVGLKYMMVSLLGHLGKVEQARRLSDELVDMAKRPAEKVLFLHQQAGLHYRAGMFEEAAKSYEQLLKVLPNEGEALNNLAYIMAEDLSRPKEAVAYAKRAAEVSPDRADVLDTLGWIYHLVGDEDQALGTLLEALQLEPDNVAARYHVAMVYKALGKTNSVESELLRALKVAEGSPRKPLAVMFLDRIKKAIAELGENAPKADDK